MRLVVLLLLALTTGCQTTSSSLKVVASAYVESERPEGKAVAKVEVVYTPPPSSAALSKMPVLPPTQKQAPLRPRLLTPQALTETI